jgi:hypothetical protein
MLATIIVVGVAAGPAFAGACKTAGKADAKEIAIDIKAQDTVRGLHVGFQLGLEPPELPAQDIAKIAAPCSRGTIKVGAGTFEVAGEDTDIPPRYATNAAPGGSIAYLALMPRPAVAWAWAVKYQADNSTPQKFSGPNDMMYALVVATGDDRAVYAYLDKIPPDARLKQYFQDALSRKLRLKASFDVQMRSTVPVE